MQEAELTLQLAIYSARQNRRIRRRPPVQSNNSPKSKKKDCGHFFCLAEYGNMQYIYGAMTYPMAAKEF